MESRWICFISVNFLMQNKQEIVGVICHDAGGAEIVSSYILLNNIKAKYCLKGPAIRVFKRKFGTIKNNSLIDIVNESSWLLSGTSWQSNLEYNAIRESIKQDKRIVVFLEHWINYPERFERNGITLLPDEIWVGDVYAKNIAEGCFENTNIELKDNPYLSEVRKSLSRFKPKKEMEAKYSALYVCENISSHMLLKYKDENYLGYTEHDSLKLFLDNIDKINKNIDTIVLRPHPSDSNPQEKYNWIERHPAYKLYDVQFSKEESLLQDIVDCDIVVGAESMAMVVGMTAEKRVVSSIPKEGRKCVLPFPEIEHILKIK